MCTLSESLTGRASWAGRRPPRALPGPGPRARPGAILAASGARGGRLLDDCPFTLLVLLIAVATGAVGSEQPSPLALRAFARLVYLGLRAFCGGHGVSPRIT